MERDTQCTNIEYKFIDRDGEIWQIEKKTIAKSKSEIVYWSAHTKNKRKDGMREFKYPTLIRKLNKYYGRRNVYLNMITPQNV
jgi:hypothetical protein